jgi:hypothetical protein
MFFPGIEMENKRASSPSSGIARAYRHTTYRVDHPDGSFGIRLGVPCCRLDALLAAHDMECWAYVTAWNPDSEKLSCENNRLRNAALKEQIVRAGYVIYPGRGEPDAGGWVAEESFLILGMAAAVATQLGMQFGQRAVVIGHAGGCAELSWCGA